MSNALDEVLFRKITGLLGSPVEAERTAALEKANAMLTAAKLDWGDVVLTQQRGLIRWDSARTSSRSQTAPDGQKWNPVPKWHVYFVWTVFAVFCLGLMGFWNGMAMFAGFKIGARLIQGPANLRTVGTMLVAASTAWMAVNIAGHDTGREKGAQDPPAWITPTNPK